MKIKPLLNDQNSEVSMIEDESMTVSEESLKKLKKKN
jgi:hypothetical protein